MEKEEKEKIELKTNAMVIDLQKKVFELQNRIDKLEKEVKERDEKLLKYEDFDMDVVNDLKSTIASLEYKLKKKSKDEKKLKSKVKELKKENTKSLADLLM